VPYAITTFIPGTMIDGQVLLYHKFSVAVTIPADLGITSTGDLSAGSGLVNATTDTIVTIAKCPLANDPTVEGNWNMVGTITFSAADHDGDLATSGDTEVSFAQGDMLRAMVDTADSTLANVTLTIAADRLATGTP